MRLSRLLIAGVLVAGSLTAVSMTARADATPDYYLALGDSLSVGYQPGQGDTSQGYADQLLPTLQAQDPNIQLMDLGCAGETTGSMINGGCHDTYPNSSTGRPHNDYLTGSQLGDAEQFLRDHAGHVKYLTLDIGANDVDGCAPGGSIDTVCLTKGTATIVQNLDTILAGLRAAGSSQAVKIGVGYYDPFLQEWLTGPTGQAVATASVTALSGIDGAMATEYAGYGWRNADIFDAFQSANFLPVGSWQGQTVPVNVAKICAWTYMCTVQNIHANPTGYGVMAAAIAKRV